ncbi:hypothetical protein LZ30DRAFT_718189 [Colletotrichum cereale]|nr:hypothetical protein LZ30DRAFT_718189 [Colletotrichum cereale]
MLLLRAAAAVAAIAGSLRPADCNSGLQGTELSASFLHPTSPYLVPSCCCGPPSQARRARSSFGMGVRFAGLSINRPRLAQVVESSMAPCLT